MSCFVQGVGAVTPLAPNLCDTWDRLCRGEVAERSVMPGALAERSYYYYPVPASFFGSLARQARLRRSGNLSVSGAVAALEAIHSAGLQPGPALAARCAVIFAICSGGVNYTRRFYHEIVTEGAQAASPLLFPETVFNAPASHVAAILGMDGRSYTLVGDSSVGLTALHFGRELLAVDDSLEHCLIVGTEEADWVLSDAFDSWRMVSDTPEFEVYGRKTGTIFGEGAGAVLIGRNGEIRIAASQAGQPFFSRAEVLDAARSAAGPLLRKGSLDAIIASANGTFADEIERVLLQEHGFSGPVYAYKPAVGDALGAGGVLQVILAAQVLRSQILPGTLWAGPRLDATNRVTRAVEARCVLALSVGFNQQVNALSLELD